MHPSASLRRKPRAPRPLDGRGRAALNRALAAHQQGDLATAERLYREVLRIQLAQPDALHYLGVLRHQQGHSDEAVELIGTALAAVPNYPDAHNNLGNIHKECGRLAEAEACYRRALACAPAHINALANLAVVLEAEDKLQESLRAYAEVLERAPEGAHGYRLMGRFLSRHPENREHLEQAVTCFRRAFELDDSHLGVLQELGVILYALERSDEACAVYREWLAREPDNPVPQHMLAAAGGAAPPPRADDAYVQQTFDRFADSFDEQLLQHLDYHAPQVLAQTLQRVLPAAAGELDVLDAGCGTGLCGPLLRAHARRLVGVDLSPGMLEVARKRGDYDELTVAELTAYLANGKSAWDVIVSADTLVYFGDLTDVCAVAYHALRDGGWFAFSLEAASDEGFELSTSGRYRHGRAHVENALHAAGFAEVALHADSLRKEVGQPVASWVVLARRRGDVGSQRPVVDA